LKKKQKDYIQKRNNGDNPIFQEIVFKDVVPLFGQVDVVGSSKARNKTIQIDLTKQLKISKNILAIKSGTKFPFYEQLIFKINNYLVDLK
jgi:hypothetical protein